MSIIYGSLNSRTRCNATSIKKKEIVSDKNSHTTAIEIFNILRKCLKTSDKNKRSGNVKFSNKLIFNLINELIVN